MPCRACAFAAKQVKKVLSPRSGLAPAAPGSPGSAGTLPGTKDGAQGPHPERSVPGWCHKAALCPQGGRPRAGEPAPLLGGTGARSSPFPWPPHTQLPMPGILGRVTGVGRAQRLPFWGVLLPKRAGSHGHVPPGCPAQWLSSSSKKLMLILLLLWVSTGFLRGTYAVSNILRGRDVAGSFTFSVLGPAG